VHGSTATTSRTFSVNLRKNSFQSFKCGAAGNQLDLWMAISGLSIDEAARDLCQRAGVKVPIVRRG
jgi:DNA primase